GAGPVTPPSGQAPPRRLLEPTVDDPAAVLAAALATYAEGGSIVLCAPQVAAELAADPARRARLVASERVTG
ncbi:MAG TPA: hypothetical protein VN257_00150, partial [Actinotalea sp.]|nr:hypothetical protein [Actinotalea sp.]